MNSQKDTHHTPSHWPVTILASTTSFLNVILPLFLARVLSPEEMGSFKIFFLYLVMLPPFTFSYGLFSGIAYWAGNKEKRAAAVQTSGAMIMLLAFLTGAIILFFRDSLSVSLGWDVTLTTLFAIAAINATGAHFFEESAIAAGRVWKGAIFQSAFELLRLSVLIISAIISPTVKTIVIAHTAVSSLKMITSLIFAYNSDALKFKIDRQILSSVWRYAFPVSLACALAVFVGKADQFILSKTVLSAEFALYSIGCLSLAPLFTIEQSITRVLIPHLSRCFANNLSEDAAKAYRSATAQLGLLFIPVVFGLIVFAKPIILILFTAQYAEASKYLPWYALAYLLFLLPYDAIARARGDSGWILKTFAIFSIVALLLAYFLSLYFGAFGALASYLITNSGMRVWSLRYTVKTTNWPIRKFIPINLHIRSFTVALIVSLLSLTLKPLFSSEILWFICCGGVFPILYFSLWTIFSNFQLKNSNEPANILIVSQSLAVGGLERMVLSLSKRLKAEGVNIVVFGYDHDPDSSPASLVPEFEKAGIQVISFQKREHIYLDVIIKMVRAVLVHQIRVVHCHDIGGLMYAVISKWMTFGRIKILQTQHSFIHLDKKSSYAQYERFFNRFCDKITAVSDEIKVKYKELGFDAEVVSNGVEFVDGVTNSKDAQESLIRDLALNLPTTQHWILYLARLYPGKGQENAIRLWGELDPKTRESSLLFIVGHEGLDGEKDKLLSLINSAPDSSRIIYIPGTQEPQRWLTASDVFLSCSESEGMPLGPLEASGSGLPVVLSDIAGHQFLKSVALFFPLSDLSLGAKALREALAISKVDYRKKTAFLRENYSISSMANRYMKIYKALS